MTITTDTTGRAELGRKLKAARMLANMPRQQQLADAIGVGRQTISGWETGEFEPRLSDIMRIADVTGQPLSWFAEAFESCLWESNPRPFHYE